MCASAPHYKRWLFVSCYTVLCCVEHPSVLPLLPVPALIVTYNVCDSLNYLFRIILCVVCFSTKEQFEPQLPEVVLPVCSQCTLSCNMIQPVNHTHHSWLTHQLISNNWTRKCPLALAFHHTHTHMGITSLSFCSTQYIYIKNHISHNINQCQLQCLYAFCYK